MNKNQYKPENCGVCNVKLIPTKTIFDKYDNIYTKCLYCQSTFCEECLPINRNEVQLDTNAMTTDGKYFDTLETRGERDDDREPHYLLPDLDVFRCLICRGSGVSRTVIVKLDVNTISEEPCYRCGSYYDKFDSGGCASHYKDINNGHFDFNNHEMPVDSNGNLVFGFNLIDFGGNYGICNVKPRLYPGRWICCGMRCDHNYPECPFYELLVNLYGKFAHTDNYDTCNGCISKLHSMERPNFDVQNNKDLAQVTQVLNTNTTILTGRVNPNGMGATLDNNWRNRATYNWATPVNYRSGAKLFDDNKDLYKVENYL